MAEESMVIAPGKPMVIVVAVQPDEGDPKTWTARAEIPACFDSPFYAKNYRDATGYGAITGAIESLMFPLGKVNASHGSRVGSPPGMSSSAVDYRTKPRADVSADEPAPQPDFRKALATSILMHYKGCNPDAIPRDILAWAGTICDPSIFVRQSDDDIRAALQAAGELPPDAREPESTETITEADGITAQEWRAIARTWKEAAMDFSAMLKEAMSDLRQAKTGAAGVKTSA